MLNDATLINQLQQRNDELEAVIQSAQADLARAPEGGLRASVSNGQAQYYHRKSPADKNGKYIDGSNTELPTQLAQKEYATRVLKLVQPQQRAIEKLLHHASWGLESHSVSNLSTSLSAPKRALIESYIPTDEDYVAQWQNQDFAHKPIAEGTKRLCTNKNEFVRSKSELIIANSLFAAGIPYHYEKPLELSYNTVLHPDFTVLNRRTRAEFLWEHLGMMDVPEYCERALNRLELYGEYGYHLGINLIITYETANRPLNTKSINRAIQVYLS